ncbi:MAG: ABC transporter ATP-binding protein [Chitinispirillaceae bacterium]|nr:ABC transporter ATP-binding protein [Chitinispirillaceae bacterium]
MVELRAVDKRYGAVTALRNVSFTIEEGEFFALLGPNGAGKTTVIRILLDFTRPTAGSAWINGIPSTDARARSIIGYLPENMQLPPYQSGRSFLKRQAALGGLTGRGRERTIDRLIDLVGMREKARRRAGTYSKGMLQRIGLAAALLGSPRVLILDEPTTGLDPVGIREFRQILERIKLDRVTMLLNSHILSEVEKLCSAAAILDKGNIVVKDAVAALVREGETLEDAFVRNVGVRGAV